MLVLDTMLTYLLMVLVDCQSHRNHNGSIWFKCFASSAFKLDATVAVTIGLNVNKYHRLVYMNTFVDFLGLFQIELPLGKVIHTPRMVLF